MLAAMAARVTKRPVKLVVTAEVPDIDVIMIDEDDPPVNDVGAKGDR